MVGFTDSDLGKNILPSTADCEPRPPGPAGAAEVAGLAAGPDAGRLDLGLLNFVLCLEGS